MKLEYLDILSLNSFFDFLSQVEKIQIIKLMLSSPGIEANPKIGEIQDLIKKFNWNPPKSRYGVDRLLYWQTPTGQWKLYAEYTHPIKEELIKLKNR